MYFNRVSPLLQVRKVMTRCHLLMYLNSFPSQLLMRGPRLREVFEDMNPIS